MHDRGKLAVIGALILWSGVLTAFAGLPYDTLDWQRFEQAMVYYSPPSPTATPTARPSSQTVGLPTLSTTDGRFIGLPGPGLRTLVQPAKFWIGIAAGATTFEVDIFDGDLGGRWDLHDPLNSVKTRFRLYADPTKSGDPDGKPLIVSTTSDVMADNGWQVLYTGPVHASALAGTGNYFYLLVVDWDRPVIAANEFNSFKIGAAGQVSITPGQWAFVGAPVNLDADPPLGSPMNTYDGSWDWYASVPTASTVLSLTECDADYRLDPTSLGDPPDDNPDPQVRVWPDIRYAVIDPRGQFVINDLAPSGNNICQTKTAPIQSGGMYRWRWIGVDAHNPIFVDSQYESLSEPAMPLLADPVSPASTPTATATAVRNLPDLILGYMAIELETGGSCNFGSTALGVRVWIRNASTAAAGSFAVDVNGVRQRVDGMAAGTSVALWFSGYSWGVSNTAVVDPLAEVEESDEGNNALSQMLPIPTLPPTCTPTATPTATAMTPTPTATSTPTTDHDLPDLIVTDITIEPQTGGSCNVTLSMNLGLRIWVQNVGQADAGPFAAEVSGVRQRAEGLAAGATVTFWFDVYVWGDKTALVDALSEVEESNEGNNQLPRWFASGWLPPTCTPTSTPNVGPSATSTPTPTPTPAQPPTRPAEPVTVSNLTDVAFTLSWATPFTDTGRAVVVPAAGSAAIEVPDVRGIGFVGDTHYVRATGLTPATTHSVSVYSGDALIAALTVHTGPTTAAIPPVDTVAGYLYLTDGFTPAGGAVVYLAVEDGDGQGTPGRSMLLSALVTEGGAWAIDLPPRRVDLQDFFAYGSGDRLRLFAEGGRRGSLARTIGVAGPRLLGGLNLAPRIDVPLQAGWNLLSLPNGEVGPLTARGLLDDLSDQGIPGVQIARWQDGRWESHLRGFPANDFPIEPGRGFFVKASGYGVWTFQPRLADAAP